MHYLREYFVAVGNDWLSFMTGALSIVLTVACLLVNENRRLRQIFLFLAVGAFIIASEDVWKIQFIRAQTLLSEAQNAEATNILQSIEFQGMQLNSPSPPSIFIPQQPIAARIDLSNKGPHRAEDFSPQFAIDIVNSSDDENTRWAMFETEASKAQPPLKRTLLPSTNTARRTRP